MVVDVGCYRLAIFIRRRNNAGNGRQASCKRKQEGRSGQNTRPSVGLAHKESPDQVRAMP
jgi:hypothetical protein